MNEIKGKYLPIGTIVTLEGQNKKIMIIGFCSTEIGENNIFDYSGCIYPEGLINSNNLFLFNHDKILKVHHYGFIDEEETKFKEELIKATIDEIH